MDHPSGVWSVTETDFHPDKIHHHETIFTLGNGFFGTRGAFEEAYPGEVRATFLHGVFDDVPVVFTELVNAPDWLELEVILAGERFSLDQGELLSFTRTLNLKTASLRRDLRWSSPSGRQTHLVFERFASLAEPHLGVVRVSITPENYAGQVEIRAGLNGEADNLAFKHWDWLGQGLRGRSAWLHCRTRATRIELAAGLHLELACEGRRARQARWDVHNHPTLAASAYASAGETVSGVKYVTYHTSREGRDPLKRCQRALRVLATQEWTATWEAHSRAWEAEWAHCDVIIEGDDEAQQAVRFNLFQLLAAAPRGDEHVNMGAKLLSGYGYRGHSFWDTEIFMLPFFTYTRPEIARNLLSYRWHNLPGARAKALANGFRGAQFPWESAGTGEEVTPTWVSDPDDRTKLIRIWTGDIEIHISADIAYAVWQYWRASGDDVFVLQRGAEIILETARFWSSRVEWNAGRERFEISDIIGPDEYHDHVNNNAFTNALARWNLQAALDLAAWMRESHPDEWRRLGQRVQLKESELKHWNTVIGGISVVRDTRTKLIEQFEGYFQRRYIDLAAMEPRAESVQTIFGIEGVNETQVLKQPDVLMLMYLLPELYDQATVRANFAYYSARTDHTFGSSLGPSIQAIMACRVNDPSAWEHFMRAARADLHDVRSNSGDGLHGASAGGLWQAVVFGFAGLERTAGGWEAHPRLPSNWTRLAFHIVDHGRAVNFDLKPPPQTSSAEQSVTKNVRAFIFDLDGVITDTSEFHFQAWQRLAREQGLPFSRQENEALRGVARRDSLELILKGKKVPEETAEAWMESKNAHYLDLVRTMSPGDLLPGVAELLGELRAAGIRVAIASSSKNASLVLERLQLNPAPDAIVDGTMVARSKPAPDLFLKAAELLGILPAQCVVVEDAASGIEAGQAAGMRTLGLGPVERVGRADLVLPDLSRAYLPDLLRQLDAQSKRSRDSSPVREEGNQQAQAGG